MRNYANIIASLALFVALGGTATAAIELGRDSVGSREIAKDAVRPSEIAVDAVRSQEIRAEAVRGSEIEDESIRLEDLADGTRSSLQGAQGPVGPQGPAGPEGPSGTSEVRFTEDDEASVPDCSELAPFECPNVQSILLIRGSWLVQAKFTISGPRGLGNGNRCGLIAGDRTTLDEVTTAGNVGALTDVLTVEAPTRVAVRCTESLGADLTLGNLTLSAVSGDEVVAF